MGSPRHVFVLMLENRSFDHMFGLAGLTGVDENGRPTTAEAKAPAGRSDFAVPADPPHEFDSVLTQLTSQGTYAAPYPKIDNGGFGKAMDGVGDPELVMRGYGPDQLPVLHQLAREFAICDHWFSSLPGPTWPNRMFAHGASSGGLDHSPRNGEILEWELGGYALPNGTVFDRLEAAGVPYRLYSGDEFPMIAALRRIDLLRVHRIDTLLADLRAPSFDYRYVFIEPSYDILNDYRGSSSMHPLADVRDGEALVKTVYEAVRANEAVWNESVLVVTWDEHGGFYDHVAPPRAVAPGDEYPFSKYNDNHFTFEQLGVRVPALVISPFVPRGVIDHRVYDHASIPKALGSLFGLAPLTKRDAAANDPLALLTLAAPRTDTPRILVPPVPKDAPNAPGAAAPEESVNDSALPSFVHAALRQHLALTPEQRGDILEQVAKIRTRTDALAYIGRVKALLGERAVNELNAH